MSLRIVDISNWKANVNPTVLDCDGLVVQVTWGGGEFNGNGITGSVWRGADAKIQAAAKRGLSVGYMHYIRGVKTPQQEAKFFADNTAGYLHKYVPSVDWEAGNNRAWGNVGYLDAFLAEFIRLTGVKPIVYRQRSVAGSVDPVCRKHDCMVWDAMYATMAATGWQTNPWDLAGYGMRQYTSNGHIGGYNGNLDLSVFVGDRKAWDKIAQAKSDGKTPAPAAPAPTPVSKPVQAGNPTVVAGTYTVSAEAVNVRDAASTGGRVVASYSHGQHVSLDGWGTFNNGFLWGRYRGGSGNLRYIAIGKQDGSAWYLTMGSAARSGNGGQRSYTIRNGDNLSTIAAHLHTTVGALIALNGIKNPNLIYPGKTLKY